MTSTTSPSKPLSFFSPVIDAFIYCDASRVPESMFVDSINYRHFLLTLRVHCNSYHTNIYVSNSYLVASTSTYKYVIGTADGDTRLFVNKVRREPLGGEIVTSFKRGEREITIYTMSDEEVWHILGFDYNAVREEVVINKLGTYRVQGDLVVEVDEYKPVNLLKELANAQERLLLDLLLRILTEMRVTAEVGVGNVILVPLTIPVKDVKKTIKRLDSVREMVVEKASSTLFEKLRELGLAKGLLRPVSWKSIIRADGGYQNCDISVFDGDASHGYDVLPYVRMNLVIATHCSPNPQEETLLAKMYEDLQKLYQPKTFEFAVGNHHVRMENVFSTLLRYRPRWQPMVLGDLVIEINVGQGRYHVTPNSTITITHDEHGIVRLKFAKEFSVRFRTLNLSDSHDEERNAIALNLLDDLLLT